MRHTCLERHRCSKVTQDSSGRPTRHRCSGPDNSCASSVPRGCSARPTECCGLSHSIFHRWCLPMGMLPQAATGWMLICRQPKACCLLYFTSGIMYNVAFLLINVVSVASPPSASRLWDRIAVQTLFSMAGFAYLVMMYRQGPAFAKSRLSKVLSTCIILSIFGHVAIGRTVPESEAPFGNRSLETLASSATAFFLACAGLCGGIASAHPAIPHQNLRPPIMEAAVLSLRVGNYMTDFGLVSVILDHVRHQRLWKSIMAKSHACLHDRWPSVTCMAVQ